MSKISVELGGYGGYPRRRSRAQGDGELAAAATSSRRRLVTLDHHARAELEVERLVAIALESNFEPL